MGRIAIVVIPFWGHMSTTLSVGKELLDRGHSVAWITAKKLNGLLIPEGGELFLTNKENDTGVSELLNSARNKKRLSGLQSIQFITEEILLPLNRIMFQGLATIMDKYKPDIILNDEQTFAGYLFAKQHNIADGTLYSIPSGLNEQDNQDIENNGYRMGIEKIKKDLGIKIPGIEIQSEELGIAFCPRNFEDPHDLMPSQQFVGPCINTERPYTNHFDLNKLANNKKKKVLVSLGTLQDAEAEKFFSLVVDDFKNSDYQVVLATNPDLFPQWPENFIVRQNLPQLKILPYTDVVITHGGANTTCETIGFGKPMVVIPFAYDQFYIASQINHTKTGIQLRYKRLKKNALLNACNEVLDDNNPYKRNIARISEIFKRAGGAKQAALLVEKHLVSIMHTEKSML